MDNGAHEVNFDGIVGPTHHYGGLSLGNVASHEHRWKTAHPRRAALEGLEKMKRLADLGIPQAVLPPHPRPALHLLRQAGFQGTEAAIIEKTWHEAPGLLSACYSASAMWTANAATITPSADSGDGRVHLTPANLVSMLHRSIESDFTTRVLRTIFQAEGRFAVHEPLPRVNFFADEGAANHTRLCHAHGEPGLHVFVYGFSPGDEDLTTGRYPQRQSLEASRAIGRLHRIAPDNCVFLRQSRGAIDAGAFHNDVVAVGNECLFLYHEHAFAEGAEGIRHISETFQQKTGHSLHCVAVPAGRLSLDEAIRTYLFNSQLVTPPGGNGMLLIAPAECRESNAARAVTEELPGLTDGRIREVRFVDLRQSMQNGGGPACLRLRIVLTTAERAALQGRVFLDAGLYDELTAWVKRHYRETLHPSDLADPALINESRRALEELSGILHLPANLFVTEG